MSKVLVSQQIKLVDPITWTLIKKGAPIPIEEPKPEIHLVEDSPDVA